MNKIFNIRNFIILVIILLIGFILYANFTIPPFITSVSDVDSLVEEDKRIVKVFTSNYFYKFNKTTYCLLLTDGSLPTVNDKGWIKANNGYCSFVIGDGDYDVYVKDKYGNISDVNKKKVKVPKKEKLIQEVDMNHGTVYLYPGKTFTVAPKNEYSEQLVWESEDASIASVSEGRITGNIYGKTKVKVHIGEDKFAQVDVVVTNLIKQPNPFVKKEYVTCNQFTNGQAAMIDSILESRVNDAGYGTRAGVVEAARFLTLEFAYEVPYFYENGRLENYEPYAYVDGEGRYYHKGLYLSPRKIKDLKASFVGPAMWGCELQNYTDWGGVYHTGQYYPNGLDCSGFVTWALLNGGFDVGDIGAGTDPNHKDVTDLGTKVWITDELMASGRVKVGDLIGLDGHAAILAGWDDQNYYIAESLNTTAGVVMTVVPRSKLVHNSIYKYIILMDDLYKSDGNLTNIWQ